MAGQHVRPHFHDTVFGEFDSGHPAKKPAVRFLAKRQHDRVCAERLEPSGRSRPPASIELHIYVDTVVRRWQGFTRGSTRHATTGRSFAELEGEEDEDGGHGTQRCGLRGRLRQAAAPHEVSEGPLRKS